MRLTGILLLLLAAGASAAPCRLQQKDAGIWKEQVRYQPIVTKDKSKTYWTTSCTVDTSTWNQLIELGQDRKPKVLLTFRAHSFECMETEQSYFCDIVTDHEVYAGKQTLTFAYFNGEYDCRDDTLDLQQAVCLPGQSPMVPDSVLVSQALKVLERRKARLRKGAGSAPKDIKTAAPLDVITGFLMYEGFSEEALNAAMQYVGGDLGTVRKRNFQRMDVFRRDLDGDGKAEVVKQVILSNGEEDYDPAELPMYYLLAIRSATGQNLWETGYGVRHCKGETRSALKFRFIPPAKAAAGDRIEVTARAVESCPGTGTGMPGRTDTIQYDRAKGKYGIRD